MIKTGGYKSMNTQTIYLHHSWKFHYGEEPDAWKKDYDDTGRRFSLFR